MVGLPRYRPCTARPSSDGCQTTRFSGRFSSRFFRARRWAILHRDRRAAGWPRHPGRHARATAGGSLPEDRVGVYNGRPMSLPVSRVWLPRTVTFFVTALTVVSAYWWVERWNQRPPPHLEPLAISGAVHVEPQVVARLLGATGPAALAQAPSAASRFVLTGVVASPSGNGAALIAVDGKPARPFQVGAMVDDGVTLRAVGVRSALLDALGSGDFAFTLEMPAPKRDGTSTIGFGSQTGPSSPLGSPSPSPVVGRQPGQPASDAQPVLRNRPQDSQI